MLGAIGWVLFFGFFAGNVAMSAPAWRPFSVLVNVLLAALILIARHDAYRDAQGGPRD